MLRQFPPVIALESSKNLPTSDPQFFSDAFSTWDELKADTPVVCGTCAEANSKWKESYLTRTTSASTLNVRSYDVNLSSEAPPSFGISQSFQDMQDSSPVDPSKAAPIRGQGEDNVPHERRPAGKLYGKSLMDDLDTRKAQMKARQK